MNKFEENNVNAETIAKVEAAPFMTYNPTGSMWSMPSSEEVAPAPTDNHSEVEAASAYEQVMAESPEVPTSEMQPVEEEQAPVAETTTSEEESAPAEEVQPEQSDAEPEAAEGETPKKGKKKASRKKESKPKAEIPPYEIIAAAKSVLEEKLNLFLKDLIIEVAKAFGITRYSNDLADRIEYGILLGVSRAIFAKSMNDAITIA